MNALETRLGEIRGGRVLDVATGDGEFVALLAGHLQDYETIVGVDIDQNLLSEARRNLSSRRIRFRVADAMKLPFRDGSFDMVTMSDALHHLVDPDRGLREMARVLKPGGILLLQEMVSDGLTEAQQTIAELHRITPR